VEILRAARKQRGDEKTGESTTHDEHPRTARSQAGR
jgi:hypothetical protein